jgi:hypothetical protein
VSLPHYVLQEAAARAEEAARLHREFSQMLRRVLDGHMDSSSFEDSCRALLGTNSYVLFTLDKLIQKFIKHMAVSAWRCSCECDYRVCCSTSVLQLRGTAGSAGLNVLGRGAVTQGVQADGQLVQDSLGGRSWLTVSGPDIAHIGGLYSHMSVVVRLPPMCAMLGWLSEADPTISGL